MNMNYPPGTILRTDDGYCFTVQPDGRVSDGDMDYANVEEFGEAVEDFSVVSYGQ